MRISRPAPLFFLCLLIPASLPAQQSASTPATSDPQATALVQRALAALTAGATVSDATLTGVVERIAGSDDETGTATVTATSAGNSKLSLSFPSGSRSEVRNNAGIPPPGAPVSTTVAAGAWSGPDAVNHGMANHNVITDATWFFPAFTFAKLNSTQTYVLSFVGQETRNGQQVLHLSASQQIWQLANGQVPVQVPAILQHLSQTDFYLDPTTLLPVAMDFNVHPDGNALSDIPAEIRFSDYRLVSGIELPFHVQRYFNNGLVLDLQFSNVTLNSGLTAGSFQIQ